MTREEKDIWTKNATPEELLETYVSMIQNNRYGCYTEDIILVKKELVRRMTKETESQIQEVEETHTTEAEPAEPVDDGTFIESYKISAIGSHRIWRRETRNGANSLADRLKTSGKHGTVEAVVSKKDKGIVEFKLIREF